MCAQKVDWESLGGQDKSGGKTAFLRFKADQVYTVRLIGHAVEFYKFYIEGETPRTVIVDPGNQEEASKLLSKHAGKEIAPQHRYAVNVIDRSDGSIKIMEGGWSIFKMFANWAKVNNQHPGGKGGADWTIDVKGERLNREYTTMPGQFTPFSEEEIDRIQVKKELYSLNEVFKSCTPDEVIEKAFGDKNGDKAPEPVAAEVASKTASQPQAQQPVAAGLADDPADW